MGHKSNNIGFKKNKKKIKFDSLQQGERFESSLLKFLENVK